jgi:hypothetical protein
MRYVAVDKNALLRSQYGISTSLMVREMNIHDDKPREEPPMALLLFILYFLRSFARMPGLP